MRKWIFAALLVSVGALISVRIEFSVDIPAEQTREQEKPTLPEPRSFEQIQSDLRDVTPDKMLPAPRIESALIERLPAVLPPPPSPKPPEPVEYRGTFVTAAGYIKSGKQIIRLDGIDPVPLDKKCIDNAGREWPCGMFARTALRQFVRGRPIACDPTPAQTGKDEIVTRCTLESYDISGWIVWQGWATPHEGLFAEELDKAKTKKYGIWRDTAPGT